MESPAFSASVLAPLPLLAQHGTSALFHAEISSAATCADELSDRGLLLGQQRALGHVEHEFRSHLLRGTHQLRSTATEQAILRKVSENRAPIAPLHHPNEGWELRLHQRQRGVFTPAAWPHRPPAAARARAATISAVSESSERTADPAAGGTRYSCTAYCAGAELSCVGKLRS